MNQFLIACAVLLLVSIYQVPAPPVPDCSCPATESNGFCPVPDNCEQFIHCDEKGMPVVYNCSDGTIWNQKIGSCVAGFKKYSCTNSPIGFVCPDGNVTTFADPSNCAGFIQCANYVAYHKTCAYGTIWDQEYQNCKFGRCS